MKLVEKIAWKLPSFIFRLLVPHYLIIGAGTGQPIGCTNGEFGKEGVLCEEPPETTFIKIKRSKCPICNDDTMKSKLEEDVRVTSKRRWKYLLTVSDDRLVQNWLDLHRNDWFSNPTDSFFGYEKRARGVAEYWLEHGKFGPDYDDPNIIRLEGYWKDWVTTVWRPA